jgi:hypothetical protein
VRIRDTESGRRRPAELWALRAGGHPPSAVDFSFAFSSLCAVEVVEGERFEGCIKRNVDVDVLVVLTDQLYLERGGPRSLVILRCPLRSFRQTSDEITDSKTL